MVKVEIVKVRGKKDFDADKLLSILAKKGVITEDDAKQVRTNFKLK